MLPCASCSGDVLDARTLGHLRARLTDLDEQLDEIQEHRDALAVILTATEGSAARVVAGAA